MAVVTNKQIFNDTVSFAAGKVYSAPIKDVFEKGFSINITANQGSGNLEATLTLESYNGPDTGWIEEPLAVFNAHPNGVAFKSTDTFIHAFQKWYRVGIDPIVGLGPVIIDLGQ